MAPRCLTQVSPGITRLSVEILYLVHCVASCLGNLQQTTHFKSSKHTLADSFLATCGVSYSLKIDWNENNDYICLYSTSLSSLFGAFRTSVWIFWATMTTQGSQSNFSCQIIKVNAPQLMNDHRYHILQPDLISATCVIFAALFLSQSSDILPPPPLNEQSIPMWLFFFFCPDSVICELVKPFPPLLVKAQLSPRGLIKRRSRALKE